MRSFHLLYFIQTGAPFLRLLALLPVCMGAMNVCAQTSWKGITSTAWATATNWTNGVPSSTVDAIIGDANFTGSYLPAITASSTCKSLTLGTSRTVTLTVSYTFTAYSSVTINSGSTISHGAYTFTVKGDWNNSGTYTGTSTSSTIKFSGTTQSINGSTATAFRKLAIAAGSTVNGNVNFSVSQTFTVSGTFVPLESATPIVVSGTSTIVVGAAGVLRVNASAFAGNYTTSGTITLNAGSTVDYSATLVNQTIRQTLTYSTLRISGTGVKTLGGNLNALNSSASTRGIINVVSGTLDLSTYTANRGTTAAGGTFSVSNGAFLKIGGLATSFFPANFATNTLSLTSTVEYYGGGTQLVSAQTYGNLVLSSNTGAAVKTLPGTAFTVAGSFSSTIGTGTSVSYTAAANIAFSGTVTIGASTTFNGGSYAHTVAGNWINNGVYTGGTSTLTMNASGGLLSGSGVNNFYNLVFGSSNTTAAPGTVINISGDLSSTGAGSFTQTAGATLSMTGASKSITGTGFVFDNLSVSGSVSTPSNISIAGNLDVSGSFSASGGMVTFGGNVKTITGAGTIAFNSLSIPGSLTASSSFSVNAALDVSGSLSASAGTATFTGTSTLNGTANLYNVALNGTSLQLATNAVLGIANTYTLTAGTLNVTASTPNTVSYNGAGAQTIAGTTYHNLVVTNGSTKTAAAGVTVNGNFTLNAGTTFNASSYTHTILGNWINNGSFTRATSTVVFAGPADASLSGATTFNIVTLNKTASNNQLSLASDVSVTTLNMTNGLINTGSSMLTITGTRTGGGVILGNIQRTHSFAAGVVYEFESPANTITFSAVSGVTSVTVNVVTGGVVDFPFGGSVSRAYNIAIPAGTYTAALRMHYEDGELNGNSESSIQTWHYNGTAWQAAGKSSNNTSANWVEQTGITSLTGRWTLSDDANLVVWNGSVSGDWSVAANWTVQQGAPSRPPSVNDIVQIGTSFFTNQPVISTAAVAKSIVLGSAKTVTLGLSAGGSLTVQGNISGSWSANATHTIQVNAQTVSVNGELVLSDGTSGHAINTTVSSGTLNVLGSITQSGGAVISFSGAGTLNITGNYTYANGSFVAGAGTVVYNGTGTQGIAGINYYHLTINKTSGICNISSSTGVTGNLSVSAGELDLNAPLSVTGNASISAGATLNGNSFLLSVGGNWSNSGSFVPSSSTVTLNGTGTQSISATTFNNLVISKASGTAVLAGNISINGNLTASAGSLDLLTYTCNRSSIGGVLSISNNVSLYVAGANNFPANYGSYTLGSSSIVSYNGTPAQTVAGVAYGNLLLANGGANGKTLAANITVNGDLTIGSSVTLNAGAYTIQLYGNWINNGTFASGTSTVLLYGTNKTISGNTTFYRFAVYGGYTVNGSDLVFNGTIRILTGGSFNVGTGTATVNGDLINSGSLISYGTTTFTGTTVQNISFYNALVSNSFGVINFNGNVSPVLNSTSPPSYATLNINNTAGVTASVGWIVNVAMNISNGATFNGGASTHTIYGSFANNGTVTSSGTLSFQPATAKTLALTGTSFSSTGKVIFGGRGAITVTGTAPVFNDVVIENTTGVTPTSNWAIGGDFSISDSAVFNAGSYSYTVAGDLQSSGTLNGGTSSFTMSAAGGIIEGNRNTTFYDFTVSGDITVNTDFNIAHNFVNNNVFTASPGTVVFTGSGNSMLSGTASTYELAQFDVLKTGGASVILSKNVTGVAQVNVNSGTLDAAAYTISPDASGGILRISDTGTLRIGGINSLPAFTNYSLDTLSTVEYYGSTQTISASASYGSLTISSAGTKTAAAALNVLKHFTLSNGTFVAGSYTHNVGGNWNMTSGAFTNTGSTIALNGAAGQTVFSTGAFNNLTIKKTGGQAVLLSNVTVNTTLTFNSGKINTGAYTVIMFNSPGTVTGAGAATGWVNGNLRKAVATGTGVVRTFEVGDTAYSPVTVNFASVSVAGTLTTKLTPGDHPGIAGSGFAVSSTVNKYWTLTNATTAFTSATATFNWVAADVDAGATTANFKVGRWASGWTQPAIASPQPASIQATGLTAFGDFIVGELELAAMWTGTTSTDWNAASNWSTAVVPGGTTRVTVPGSLSRYPVIGSGSYSVSDLIIQSGASLTVSGATLKLIGTVSNSGTFTAANNATIELAGSVAQTIPANTFSANTLYNLTVNNQVGATLGGTLNITNTLTIANGSLQTGGYLVLKSSAAATARVATITSSAGTPISGNVKVERFVQGRRKYRLLCSSVTTSASAGLSAGQEALSIWGNWQNAGNNLTANTGTIITGGSAADGFDQPTNFPSLYTYDDAARKFVAFSSANSRNTKYTPLKAGVAYNLFVYGDRTNSIVATTPNNTVLAATGVLLTGDQSYTTSSAIPLSGVTGRYTLLGNPFASPIDWSVLPRTDLDNTYWGWDPNLSSTGGYVTVSTNGTVTLISPYSGTTGLNQYIQPGQGFFVRTSGAAPALTIREQDKSAITNTNAFRMGNPQSQLPLLAVNLLFDYAGTAVLADGVVAAFDTSFSNGTGREDAAKLVAGNEAVSILSNGELWSIEGRSSPQPGDSIRLNLLNLSRAHYTLQIFAQQMNGLPVQPYLADAYLHTEQPLLLNDTNQIGFDINLLDPASVAPDRFSIFFRAATILDQSFVLFQVSRQTGGIRLDWKVAQDEHAARYHIESSADGIYFSAIRQIEASGGSGVKTYQWTDPAAFTQDRYYRIRMIRKDGIELFSKIIKVPIETARPGVAVYPNPVRGGVIGLEWQNGAQGTYQVALIDGQGKEVFVAIMEHTGGSSHQSLPVNKKLPAGTYYLRIRKGDVDFHQTILIQD